MHTGGQDSDYCNPARCYGPPVIRERVPGFDPREFWSAELDQDRVLAMRDKYEAQAELATTSDPATRKLRLKALARRWPGSLREAELIGPTRVGERLEQARLAARAGSALGTGEAWRARGDSACAVLLWAHLHPLLADLIQFRRAEPESVSVAGLTRWVLADPTVAERWPGGERLADLVGDKLEVRCAYLWLAARAGLGLAELNGLLLARSGPWDRRASDPPWSHDEQSG